MPLFKSKESYLGVDIGTASIKIVQLEPVAGRPKLVTYGYVDIASDIVHSKAEDNQAKIVNSLKKVAAQAKVTTNLAIAALPTFSVFNSIIVLPVMNGKDLASAVKWEAKKYIPLPLEEMILDWKIVKDNNALPTMPIAEKDKKPGFFSFLSDNKKKSAEEKPKAQANQPQNLRILVTAAPKNLVNRYLSVFREAGLKLISLETEAFALARSFIGNDNSTVMIVDIGSITTDICVIEKGVPVLNRSIDLGGLTITKAIAASLNVSPERAEQFKRDFGVTVNQELSDRGVNKTISTTMSPIINEVKYVLSLYQSQQSQTVEKIILSGGSAFLPNLANYFEMLFNKPTILGNPWDKVVYPAELKPALDEVGSRLAVAIGLAMRDIK